MSFDGGKTPLVNVRKILIELKAERARLTRAIAALEKLTPQRKSRSVSGSRTADTPTSAPKEKRGQLLAFRKLKVSARSRTSKAEEA
jgi:hypothetical protein